LRHAGNLLDLSVHGTHNLVGCTTFTTSGSTSAYTSTIVIPGVDGYPFETYRDLETRKEMRERAWESDGWADTVHKARPGISRPLLSGSHDP
jgi:hypothetical protein